jgi:hypothetical protein
MRPQHPRIRLGKRLAIAALMPVRCDLIITVQQIVTTLKTAETEDGRFTVVMKAVYGLVRK